jgi:electron transport complex protein RnfG
MREILGMIVVLSCICGASGFALAYLKETTAPIIEAQVLENVQGPAIRQVYPAADNQPVEERKSFTRDNRQIMVFPYKQGGRLVGVALEGRGRGFGGDIGVIVGFNMANDTLLGIGVTDMKETPGLGTKIAGAKFSNQFRGAPLTVGLKAGGGVVDAVSGATISSTGAVTAVQAASAEYQALKEEIRKTFGNAE